MPATQILYYREGNEVPVLEFTASQSEVAQDTLSAAIRLLAELGYEARRPLVENLGGGIYELRVRVVNVQLRILYFFHGQGIILLAHGLRKEREVPAADLRRALERKARYEANPESHTAVVEL
jgi:phage-related protein